MSKYLASCLVVSAVVFLLLLGGWVMMELMPAHKNFINKIYNDFSIKAASKVILI